MSAEVLKNQIRQQAQGATRLHVAYIGITGKLFATLQRLQQATPSALAEASHNDPGYVRVWCDAAFAFEYLEVDGETFRLSEVGLLMCPDHPETLMPMVIQAMVSAHMADRAAELLPSGERPGEAVLGERATLLPWFGPMLEHGFGTLFEQTICPALSVFTEVDTQGGLALDLGCGNGWYLRALARRCKHLRGIGLDGFEENIRQARTKALAEGLENRLQFQQGDIHDFDQQEAVDLIAMNRALHHVWERDQKGIFQWLHDHLKPGGHAVIWEPAWPEQRETLRLPARRGLAFQNLSEYIQGNHLLRPQEIVEAFHAQGMTTQVHEFMEGNEVLVVARRPHGPTP